MTGAGIPAASSPAQSRRVSVEFRGRESTAETTDLVTIEEPMEIRLVYGPDRQRRTQSLAVTMRTPGDDFDLARGFLFTESIASTTGDILDISYCGPPSPDKGLYNTVQVTLASHVAVDADKLLRHFYTSSSCGVCGKASLDAVRVQLPQAERDDFEIAPATVNSLPAALRAAQTEFDRTGGLHASACFDSAGRIVRLREDVGRHNALDKLIGASLHTETDGERPLAGLGVLLSGRASFELIQKAAMTGTAFVAAVGPPSSLAVELAAETGLTLVGFLKAATFNLYVNPERIV